jgi:hypothetical protein
MLAKLCGGDRRQRRKMAGDLEDDLILGRAFEVLRVTKVWLNPIPGGGS